MRLALETQTPIVPVAVIGAEEQAPAVNVKPLARLLGAPSFPLVPYPPFVPLLPLPVKFRIRFGEPMWFTGDSSEEDSAVEKKVEQVKDRIRALIEEGRRARRNWFV